MKNYIVEVTDTLKRCVVIQEEDGEMACDMAVSVYMDDIMLDDARDFVERGVKVVGIADDEDLRMYEYYHED